MNFMVLNTGTSCSDVRPPGLAVINTTSECLAASAELYPSVTFSDSPQFVTQRHQSDFPAGCSYNKFSCSGTCPPYLRVNIPDPNVSGAAARCGSNRRCLCRVVARDLTDDDVCSMLGGIRNSEYPRACCSASCGLGGCNKIQHYFSDCNPQTFYGTRHNHNRPCSTGGMTPCTVISGLPASSPSRAPEPSPSPSTEHHQNRGGPGGMDNLYNNTALHEGGSTISIGLIIGLVLLGLLIVTLMIYFICRPRSKSRTPNGQGRPAPAPRVRAVQLEACTRPSRSPDEQQIYINRAPVLPVPLVQAGQPIFASPVNMLIPQGSPYPMQRTYQLQQPVHQVQQTQQPMFVPVAQPVVPYPTEPVPMPRRL